MDWDITGIGAVASVGASPEEIFGALCAGRSGLAKLRSFDLSKFRAHYAYEIDDRPPDGRDEPWRATRWLHTAIGQALRDAGRDDDLGACPVVVGTTLREQRSIELWWRGETPAAPANLHFGTSLRERFGATRTYTVANACAASLCALGMATDMIELGVADTVVVAGTDAITESAYGGLDRVQNDSPEALRPLDRDRKGMLMGEGAVAVVVQRAGTHHRPRARLRALSMNCDASHPTVPAAETIDWVIRDAHRRAGIEPDDVDLVLMHGSGTQVNDQVEATVLAEVFAGRRTAPLVTAIKSATGHTLGGSGLLSLVIATLSLRAGLVPPIVGLVNPIDEANGLRLVRGVAAAEPTRTAQIDAFGFGGINAVAIVAAAS